MNLEEEIVQLRTENQRLREQIVLLEQRIVELEQGNEPPPASGNRELTKHIRAPCCHPARDSATMVHADLSSVTIEK